MGVDRYGESIRIRVGTLREFDPIRNADEYYVALGLYYPCREVFDDIEFSFGFCVTLLKREDHLCTKKRFVAKGVSAAGIDHLACFVEASRYEPVYKN